MGAPALPPLASALGKAKIAEVTKGALDGALEFEPLRGWIQDLVERLIPGITAGWTSFQLESRADFMIRLVTALLQAEDKVGPKLLQLAALGLEDYFGVHIDPASLGIRGGTPGRIGAAGPLSDALLSSLFGTLGSLRELTPERGYDDMLHLVERSLLKAVESWLEGNLGLGIITKDLPGWDQLGELVSHTIGMGRLTSRALRPLVDVLILEPAKQHLAKTYRNALPSEALAFRLLNRGAIGEEDYFEVMARHGWDRTAAAEQKLANATLPSRADLAAMLELGLVDAGQVRESLVAQGFPGTVADQLLRVIQEDRTRTLRAALAQLARDMYRDREATAEETGALLERAGYSADERALLFAVADLERSRPKRLSVSTMEDMFRREVVTLPELRGFYELEGYAPADVDRLEAMAVKDKLHFEKQQAAAPPLLPPEAPGALPRGVAQEAYRRGILSDEQLRTVLESQGLKDLALETEIAVGKAHRREYLDEVARHVPITKGLTTSAGTVEDAYVRGLVGDARSWRPGYLSGSREPHRWGGRRAGKKPPASV